MPSVYKSTESIEYKHNVIYLFKLSISNNLGLYSSMQITAKLILVLNYCKIKH